MLTKMEKHEIEARAQELLETNGINPENGVDVVQLARKLDFMVGSVAMDDSEDGFILYDPRVEKIEGMESNKIIGVNSNRNYEDKRFIIAHELAHYAFRSDDDTLIAAREHKRGRNEDENWYDYFAACLLMPSKEFKKRFAELKNNGIKELIDGLKDTFGVSDESAYRRMLELNLNPNY